MGNCIHPDAGTVAKAYHESASQVARSIGFPPFPRWEDWDPQMRELATATMDKLLTGGVIRYTPPNVEPTETAGTTL